MPEISGGFERVWVPVVFLVTHGFRAFDLYSMVILLTLNILKEGLNYPPKADLFAIISEPFGVKSNALVTFPQYDGTTKWHMFRSPSPTLNSKMASAKPTTNIFHF